MLAHPQPLFVNCQLPPATQSVPIEFAATTPGLMRFGPLMISPGSSGRFDGYDSDASSSFYGTPPSGSAGNAAPAVYQQPSPYQPPYQLQYPPVQYSPMQYSPLQYSPPQYQQQYAPMPQYAQQPQQPLTMSDAAWRDKFLTAFSSFSSGSWHLKFVSEPPDLHNSGVARNAWRYRQDQSPSVQFVCRNCRHSVEATGNAVFWIHKNDATNIGQIWLKLYTRRCASTGGGCGQGVADPVWQPAEAARALDGLFQQVAQAYYGASDVSASQSQQQQQQQRRQRRHGKAPQQQAVVPKQLQ